MWGKSESGLNERLCSKERRKNKGEEGENREGVLQTLVKILFLVDRHERSEVPPIAER